MLKEITMYTVVCDNCGKDCNEGSEYSCYGDSSGAIDVARDSGWHCEDDKDYCESCWSYDDDNEIVIKPIPEKDGAKRDS